MGRLYARKDPAFTQLKTGAVTDWDETKARCSHCDGVTRESREEALHAVSFTVSDTTMVR